MSPAASDPAVARGGEGMQGMQGTVRAVILAGGRGTRLAPLTDTTPKPLLPVAGRPVVVHQLLRLAAAGVRQVCLSTGYRAEQFEPVLGDGSAYGVALTYAVEFEPLGTGGAIAAALDALGTREGDPLLVCNGDQLIHHDLQGQVLDFAVHHRGGASASIHVRRVDDARAFGLVDADETGCITDFREKPTERVSGLVNAGTYVLDARLLSGMPRGQQVSFEREVLPRALREGCVVRAYEDERYGVDIGTPTSLVAESRGAVLATGTTCLIDPAADVDPSAVVDDGSWIGPHTSVGALARVRASILMPGARVGARGVVEQSVLGHRARVADGITLRDCVVGDGAVVRRTPSPGSRISPT